MTAIRSDPTTSSVILRTVSAPAVKSMMAAPAIVAVMDTSTSQLAAVGEISQVSFLSAHFCRIPESNEAFFYSSAQVHGRINCLALESCKRAPVKQTKNKQA